MNGTTEIFFISLLSVIMSQINKHIYKFNILSENKSGFQSGYNLLMVLLSVIDISKVVNK